MESPNQATKTTNLKLHKSEKLCSQTAIDALFDHKQAAKGAIAYPLRIVSAPRTSPRRCGAAPVQFLISVPKKRLRHAVDRVRMRRLIREAFRLNRDKITADPAQPLDIAFIYVGSTLSSYARVERAMIKLLATL